MPVIPNSDKDFIKKLYLKERMSMSDIANKIGVGLDAVVYFMRKHKIPRRSPVETNAISFHNKKPSFNEKIRLSVFEKELKLSGLMLYWSEGHKSATTSGIDFTNSDPEMISIFVKFLRIIYRVDEERFRILLYCYANQDVKSLVNFWSKLTKISKKQFTKPYIRKDFREDGRKMKYGMVHIRYADKKLFLSIMNSIEGAKSKLRRW